MKARGQRPQLFYKVSTKRLNFKNLMPGAYAVVSESLRIKSAFNQFIGDLQAGGDSTEAIAYTLPLRAKTLMAFEAL